MKLLVFHVKKSSIYLSLLVSFKRTIHMSINELPFSSLQDTLRSVFKGLCKRIGIVDNIRTKISYVYGNLFRLLSPFSCCPMCCILCYSYSTISIRLLCLVLLGHIPLHCHLPIEFKYLLINPQTLLLVPFSC